MPETDKWHRCRIIPVDEHTLLALFRRAAGFWFDPPLPPDAEILALHAEWASVAIHLKVCSMEWPVVPSNTIPPFWDGRMMIEARTHV